MVERWRKGKKEKRAGSPGSGGVENMGSTGSGPTSIVTWLALVGGRDASRQD